MGEIADMMIYGSMCACGQVLDGDEPGYQRFCSEQCKQDYGGEDWGEVADMSFLDEPCYTSQFRCRLFSTPDYVQIRAFMPGFWRGNPKFQHSKRK